MGDLFEQFGDFLHEVPEAEDALRRWRDRQAKQALERRLRGERIDILVKSLGGYEPGDG